MRLSLAGMFGLVTGRTNAVFGTRIAGILSADGMHAGVTISAESSVAMMPWRIEPDLCKACELCIAFCPKHCLALGRTLNSRGYYPVVLQDPDACNACALCGQVCPDVAIRVYRKVRAKK